MKKQLKHIKDEGFKVPNNYFDDIENTIFTTIKLNQVFTKNESGYDIPKGYFNNLENTIFNRLNDKQNSKPKVLSLFKRKNLVYISGVAAVILIMLSILIPKEAITFDNIELDIVENYLSNQDISSDELLSFLSDDISQENKFIQNNIDEASIDDIILDNTFYDDVYE